MGNYLSAKIPWSGVAVGLWATIACSTQPPVAHTSVRDSAGVRIVENSEVGNASLTWVIPDDPVFRIGWEPSDPQFQRIESARITGSGAVAVADQGIPAIFLLTPEGELFDTLGRRGEGPGEFRRIDAVLPLGRDSLLVQDSRNQRVSVFANGQEAGSFRFLPRVGSTIYSLSGRTGEGGFFAVPTAFIPDPTSPAGWTTAPLLRPAGDFSRVDTIALRDFRLRPEPGRPSVFLRYGFSTAADAFLLYGRNDRPEIQWINGDGTVVQIARWDAPSRTLSEQDWTMYESHQLATARDEANRERVRERLGELRRSVGEAYPWFRLLMGDRDGNVWLSEYSLMGLQTTTFSIISRKGKWLGTIQLPLAFQPLDIASDLIVGIETNEWDVQAIVAYEIVKPPS